MKPSGNVGLAWVEFLLSFVLKTKNNILFFIETNVKEEQWACKHMHFNHNYTRTVSSFFCSLKEEGQKHIFHHVYKILTKNFVAIFKIKASVCAKIFLVRFPKAIIGH